MFRRSGRFAKRSNKSKEGKDPLKFYSIFNPHDGKAPLKPKKGDWVQIASMDPAILFFGLRCERIHKDGTKETIEFSLTNFTKDDGKEPPEVGRENFYYIKAVNIISKYCEEFLKDCHYIIIESQLSFNYDMVRLSSHIIAIMCTLLKNKGNRPLIIEMDPKLKSRLLGAPPLKGDAVKKWCSKEARKKLAEEGDTESLDFMDECAETSKDYDLADVKCQITVAEIMIATNMLPKIHSRNTIKIAQV
jgi:hypothetical protein